MRGQEEIAARTVRITLELSSENGTVHGTLRAGERTRSFRSWLELMSALELATGTGGRLVATGEPRAWIAANRP